MPTSFLHASKIKTFTHTPNVKLPLNKMFTDEMRFVILCDNQYDFLYIILKLYRITKKKKSPFLNLSNWWSVVLMFPFLYGQ